MRSIELSLLKTCPVRCEYCPQGLLQVSQRMKPATPAVMSIETLRRVLDNATHGGYRLRVDFAGFTEPLLHPRCIELMWICDEHPFVSKVKVYTTGEGFSYDKIRYMSRMRKLSRVVIHADYQHALGETSSIQTNAKGTVWRYEQAILNHLRSEWRFPRDPGLETRRQVEMQHPRIDAIWVKEVTRGGNVQRQQQQQPAITHDGPVWCSRVTRIRKPVVLYDGSTQACCNDYGLELPVGSLREQTWDELDYDEVLRRQQQSSAGSICHTGCHFARSL